MKIDNFQGELTDISAKKEALMSICCCGQTNFEGLAGRGQCSYSSKTNLIFFGYFGPINVTFDMKLIFFGVTRPMYWHKTKIHCSAVNLNT